MWIVYMEVGLRLFFFPCAWYRLPNVACRVDLDLDLCDEKLRPYDVWSYIFRGRPTVRDGFDFAYPVVTTSVPHTSMSPSPVCTIFVHGFIAGARKSNLEPENSSCETYRANPTPDLYVKVVPRWNGIKFQKVIFVASVSALTVRVVGCFGDHASVVGPSDGTEKSRHTNYVPRSKSKKRWIQCRGQVWKIQKVLVHWRSYSCWGELAGFEFRLWEGLHEVFHHGGCRDVNLHKKSSHRRDTR